MATQKVVKLDSFKRGDTPVFAFTFTAPFTNYDWSNTTADCAFTDISDPSDNSQAGFSRLAQPLTINGDGTSSLTVQPTVVESKALAPGTTYKLEVQLKDGGGSNVATAITATVTVDQDYVI